MLPRRSVLTNLDHQVTLQDECPTVHKHVTSVCTKGGKSHLKGAERSRSKRSSLSRFVNFISGSAKSKKKLDCESKFDFPQLDLYFGDVYLKGEHSTMSCVNLSLLKRSSDIISRRRSGNDRVFGRDSSRTVDMNIRAALYDRPDFIDAGNCVSPSKHRRVSLPPACISALRDDSPGDRPRNSFTRDTTGEFSQNEEINRSRLYRKSLSRGRLTSSRKIGSLPRSLRSSFSQKRANASSTHLHNQTLDSCNPGQRQLILPAKQSSNKTVDSSRHGGKRMSGHLKQTVESSNYCHKQTFNSAKPVGGDRNMAGTELKAADSVHNIGDRNMAGTELKAADNVHNIGDRNMAGTELKAADSVHNIGDRNMAGTELKAADGVYNIGTASCHQGHVDKAERVASWAANFDQLLQDPLGINIFTKFLEKEFSDENIRFWQVCQEFRGLTDQQQQQALVKDIYNRHIAMRASDPVNVDNAARSHTEQFLDSPTAAMFDVAQSQIQRLMKLDSYPRFLKSDLYKNVLTYEMEGKVHDEPEKVQEMKKDKKENVGKENGGKRRRSLLPWNRFL